jgi:hypothetical protein
LHNSYSVRPKHPTIRSPDLILYDPRKVLALDAPGCASPDEPDGASFSHRNDSFVCKAVTALVERTGIVMLIVRLDNNGFNKAVVRQFVMLSVCNSGLCDNTHGILRDGDKPQRKDGIVYPLEENVLRGSRSTVASKRSPESPDIGVGVQTSGAASSGGSIKDLANGGSPLF